MCFPRGGFTLDSHAESYALEIVGCEDADLEGMQRLLNIELKSLSRQTAEWLMETHPAIEMRCSHDLLHVEVRDPSSGRFVGQSIERHGEMQKDLKRFVALTLVELIASSAADGQKQNPVDSPMSTPGNEKKVTDDHSAGKRISRETDFPRYYLGLFFALGGGQQPFALTYGAGVAFSLGVVEYFALAVDVLFLSSQHDVEKGEIQADNFGGAIFGTFRLAHHIVTVNGGVGLRAGALMFRGSPDKGAELEGHSTVQPWGGPCLTLMTRFRLSSKLRFALHGEVGYTIWKAGAMVDDKMAVSQEGVWVVFGAGIGWSMK